MFHADGCGPNTLNPATSHRQNHRKCSSRSSSTGYVTDSTSHEEVKRLTDRVAYLEGLVQPGDMLRWCSTARSAGSLDSHTVAGDEKKKDGSSYGSKNTVTESNGLGKRRHSLDSKDEPFPKKHQMDPAISPLESIRPMSTPQSPSTIEAQVYIQQELDATKDLSSTRRTVLKSAMEFINQLSERPKVTIGTRMGFSCGGTALQDIHYPTIEFLFWMLKGKLPRRVK